MPAAVPLTEFVSDRFLREIHRFLWLEVDFSRPVADGGWNCRDHALISAFLMQACGYQPMLAHGEAFFHRQMGGNPPVTIMQQPHTWILLDGAGVIDLSIKSDFQVDGTPHSLGFKSVFASAWSAHRRNKVYVVEDGAAFDRAVKTFTAREHHACAVYHPMEAEYLHGGQLTHSAGWIRSPLTQRLQEMFGDPCQAYAALILHLHAFLRRRTGACAGLGFEEAWRRIVLPDEDAVDGAARCIADGFVAS